MTEKEAINVLQLNRPFAYSELQDAVNNAIKALEEIQAYRAIGTVAKLKALKEKDVPKKPLKDMRSLYGWICPNCKEVVFNEMDEDERMHPTCCDVCGQKLEWT